MFDGAYADDSLYFFPCFYTSLARWDRPEWNERPLVVYREGQVIGVSAELKGRACGNAITAGWGVVQRGIL